MKQLHLVAALLLLPALACADGAAINAIKQKNQTLENLADACMFTGRTAYVKLRSKESTAEDEQELVKCIGEGKASAKQAHAEIKTIFKNKNIPAELAEWRVEWMAAFDATALKPGEVENQYLRRVQDARSKVERATNKLEISFE
jgi:hypothetical protein